MDQLNKTKTMAIAKEFIIHHAIEARFLFSECQASSSPRHAIKEHIVWEYNYTIKPLLVTPKASRNFARMNNCSKCRGFLNFITS